jgi:hypothetical protein
MSSSALRFQVFLRYGRPDSRIVHGFYRRLLAYVSVSFGRSKLPILSVHLDILI